MGHDEIWLFWLSLGLFGISLIALFFVRSNKIVRVGVGVAFVFLVLNALNFGVYYYMGRFLHYALISILAISAKGAPIWIFYRQILLAILVLGASVLACIILRNKIKNSNFKKRKFAGLIWSVSPYSLLRLIH